MSIDVAAWRGVASEETEDVDHQLAGLLRGRSRRLLGSLLRPHRRALGWGSVLLVINTAADLAGPFLVQQAIDRGLPPLVEGGDGSLRPILTVAGFYLLASLVGAVAWQRFLLLAGRIGENVLFDLRHRLFDHFQRLSLSFHQRYTSGRVISRLTSDIDALAELLGHGLSSIVTSVLLLGGIGVMLLLLDWALALVVLAAFPAVLVLSHWFRQHSERAYRATREAVALVIVHFTETLGGIRAVKAFRREPRNQEVFETLNNRYRDANVWSSDLAGVFGPGVNFLGRVTTVAVLVYGGTRVLDGHLTLGVLAAFLLYLRRFFEPLHELSQFYNLFQAANAALEKLSGVLEEAPAVPEPIRPAPLAEPTPGEIRFDAVRFSYREEVVLHDLDLHVPAGQTVALVGATGAGKTTIARLIARFWDPSDGRVMLDGVDLRDIADDRLRRAVVMVTQENVLFGGSVADNIAFGRPDATRAEIEAAAEAIGAHAFISELAEGYDTDVRKRGGRLSAGQRQLVAFARAFIADPSVLILDEATSSLDIPSERQVQRALRTLLADRTALIIAHRLTTVEIADRVLVLDAGRVVEDGLPDELVAAGGRYGALRQAWTDSLV
jgi:ABC-type multidrug transport system fused ATPase/permease subunit